MEDFEEKRVAQLAEDLTKWFGSKHTHPADAHFAMIRIHAAMLVSQGQDFDKLAQGINLLSDLLTADVARMIQSMGQSDAPTANPHN